MTPKKRKANDRTGNAFDAALETNDLFVNPPDYERDYRVDEDAGVRFVVPYFFDFICGVKGAMGGETTVCAVRGGVSHASAGVLR
jgi:hypothetical protein